MSTTLNDSFWLERITQCRSSGLTDRQWCIENGIPVSTFYYHVRALRKKACEIPETADTSRQKQEVVQIPFWEEGQRVPDGISAPSPSICLQMQGIRVEIHEHAGADVIRNTLLALHQLCQGELSGVAKFFLVDRLYRLSEKNYSPRRFSVPIVNRRILDNSSQITIVHISLL